MLHHLREDRSAKMHAPLSGLQVARPPSPQTGESRSKKFKSKNLKLALNS